MMKKALFLFILFACSAARSQSFSIPAEEYPFFDIIEWKGNGAILLNRDPSGLKRKINMTMVADKTTSVWQESFNPTGKEYYYIHGENSRYVYFLEQLQPVEGKISFCQVNIAGNVKNSTALLSTSIKKLGDYDINLLKMIDVFTTDKALVFLMRYQDKKEKKFVDFLVTMTHHNMLIYASIIAEIPEVNLKDPRYGHWSYAGYQGENILFYARDVIEKKAGFSVKTFSSKAELTESRFIEGPGVNFESVTCGSFGTTGRYYLGTNEASAGQLYTLNGKFYVSGFKTEGTAKNLELYGLENAKWTRLKSAAIAAEISKKPLTLNSVALNEGLACIYGSKSYFLPFSSEGGAVVNEATNYTPFNPSSTMVKETAKRFAVSLPTGTLFFDPKQLNVAGAVKFEFVKK